MKSMRAAVGFVLGPLVIGVYYLWLRAVNRKGVWQAVVEDGISGELLRGARGIVNAGAVTIQGRIFTRYKFPSFRLVRHELEHVKQWSELGYFGFTTKYGAEMATRGYRAISLEQEARDKAGV